jgi:carbamoyl-phosphate synthase small subunit
MAKTAILVLTDGSVYEGFAFGAETDTIGEAVFNTSMAGYQEMLTDPSYAGQILIPTYPLIGNYGTNDDDVESKRIQVKGFIVREECDQPNHYLNNKTIHDYLAEGGIPGIWGVDTRAITRRLRSAGVMMGMITSSKTPAQALEAIRNAPDYGSIDFVKDVTTDKAYKWEDGNPDSKYHVVALDCGLKYNILRLLAKHGCRTTVVPCQTPAEEILSLKPDGILLSPGPGDPALLDYIVDNIKRLVGKKPIMGICLGNQLIARAYGGKTFKLKFGHRGGNHPVRDLKNGRIHITAQNHGYAVDPDTIGNELEVTHINLNDNTVEGIRHKELPIFAIQYHSEASPGPLDNVYLFQQFMEMIKEGKIPLSPPFSKGET